jgi:ElaB/YqjD/DUF883 family membrane-anchored ribosome-binding protein
MADAVDTITQNLPIPDSQKQMLSEKAGQVTDQVTGTITSQVGVRASQVGEQATTIAGALRTSGEQLRSQGQSAPANVVDMAAERAEQLGQYLSYSDPNQILGDVEDFCRQQPWVVIAGGIAAGFVAARFLKASSTRRYDEYQTRRYSDGNDGRSYNGYGYARYRTPPPEPYREGGF